MLAVDPPIHPGEILRTEFMEPLGLSTGKVAKALNVPRTRIERLVREETQLTADTAARLGQYFRTGMTFWMNIRVSHEYSVAKKDTALSRALEAIVPLTVSDAVGERDAAA
jgi:antitoxin HigA-1